MASSVMYNNTVALVGEEEHLILPIVTIQRPAMREGDGSGGILVTPILVVSVSPIISLR